jgi:hypothetical protein
MAKTVFLNNHEGIQLSFEVDTTVAVAESSGGVVKVYPAALQTISFSTLLEIAGVGEVTVSSVGADGSGDYFTYAGSVSPAPGAVIRTPWLAIGPLRYTRAGNGIRFTYEAVAEHDLYFATQKTSDSGLIVVKVDGETVANSPFDLHNESTVLAAVLLKEDVGRGEHTVEITASITPPDQAFVYFDKFELLEHVRQTGGFYYFRGPKGTIEDSTINFVGDWSAGEQYAFTTTIGASAFFYPQLGEDGQIKIRVQKTSDSGIVEVYKDGEHVVDVDLYANPAQAPVDIILLTQPPEEEADQIEIELRVKDDSNPLSTGNFFYLRGTVVFFSRTDLEALQLAADYLRRVAGLRPDGAFLDAYDSQRINFDSNALYACMGLLAAHQVVGNPADPVYLHVVRDFLAWFAAQQVSAPGVPFDDGHWKIGYRVNPEPPPTYLPAIAPYDAQGITEIRWVDAVQCLGAFVLWWYWKLSGDNATRDALLPVYRKGIDGFITNNHEPATGFFFSSWQFKTAPTIFLYHDAIRRYNSAGALIEQHNNAEPFFSYSPTTAWSSYGPAEALGADEHFTLTSGAFVQFALSLSAGDKVKWLTQTAWDVGIADILISDNGTDFSLLTSVDAYTPTNNYQQEREIYTASSTGAKHFRIVHSGTINAAGAGQVGWQRLSARYSAGQTDVLLGLVACYLMTRSTKYSSLAVKLLQRYPGRYWSAADLRWYIGLEGGAPGTGNSAWYPFPHGYTVFGQQWSRLFAPTSLFAEGLQALEPHFTEEDGELDGGIQPPGFLEPEHIFSAFYAIGENQLSVKTDEERYNLSKEYVKSGQYFLTLAGQQVGGIVFSKRYPYLYTNIAGFACMALAGTLNPFTEQLPMGLGVSRMILPQYGEAAGR